MQQESGGFFLHFGVAGARGGQGGEALVGLAQAVGQKRDAVVTYTLGGVQHLAAVRRVPVTGWSVVATAPQSELHAPAVHTRNVMIIVSAVAVLLAALVFFIFARAFRRSPTASSQ